MWFWGKFVRASRSCGIKVASKESCVSQELVCLNLPAKLRLGLEDAKERWDLQKTVSLGTQRTLRHILIATTCEYQTLEGGNENLGELIGLSLNLSCAIDAFFPKSTSTFPLLIKLYWLDPYLLLVCPESLSFWPPFTLMPWALYMLYKSLSDIRFFIIINKLSLLLFVLVLLLIFQSLTWIIVLLSLSKGSLRRKTERLIGIISRDGIMTL